MANVATGSGKSRRADSTDRQSGIPRASQAQVDLGRMAEKASFHYHPQSGERVANPPQVRITPKGIDALRAKLARQLVAV